MPNLWIVFLTGLTTGGLSCLAVQGGLLANVIAKQAEDEYSPKKPKAEPDLSHMSKNDLLNYYSQLREEPKLLRTFRGDIIRSILLFLSAKIFAYTLLGFGLGWAGSLIQLTPLARGMLMLAIAIFMLGTALRMLNIHPIFNYFQISPPKFIRTFIRRFRKNSKTDIATPLFLGALTVLIPCGVTQAMMALALGTASPIAGAVVMFAFTLGASPLFFALAYLTTRLGEKLNAHFLRIVAVLVLVFSLYSLESGLNLVGSPVSYSAYKQWINTPETNAISTNNQSTTEPSKSSDGPGASEEAKEQELTINAVDWGYEPNVLKAKAGIPTKIKLVTEETYSCSIAFTIPTLRIQKILDPTGVEYINLPPQKRGTLRFSCSMGMYTGRIIFE